ncbi:MAG: aminotransferase class I/II-fold pyridoxal phosphate-dependent enzyme [Clostridia bacterium]|nr:aminotransferase class I/II-fold pyridoxal phosphate-dependent enzyme [Clostridia bacterium]
MKYTENCAQSILAEERKKYEEYKGLKLSLDMSRGKPNGKQLDLSKGLFDSLNSESNLIASMDYRNYGCLDGIPEAKELFAELCGVKTTEIMVLGNSSLNIMYDNLQRSMQFGLGGNLPFNKQEKLKWICPVPGYDRHFAITELFGFEMINVPIGENGPDMDIIEELVKDEAVKGIWCIPKFSNPQGIVFSDDTVRRFAQLKPAAKDFRIYWDNAYAVHYIDEDVQMLNLLNVAKEYNNDDIVYMFGSTSKITFPGAGVAYVCANEKNLAEMKKYMTLQTIGPNKLNQIAHVRFFGSVEKIHEHMAKHAKLLKPKFDTVVSILTEELDNLCSLFVPHGGYFISCDLPNGTAKRAVELAKNVGVVMTPAGATYPYKKDPNDCNVRVAPTFPGIEELTMAMKVFCCCVKIAWAEKVINA